MSKYSKFCLPVFLSALIFTTCGAFAQAPEPPLPPAPSALFTAKRLFLSNAGADSGLFPSPFSGTPDRGYVQFYTALQSLQRFTLVSDPAQADLVLQLQLSAPNGPANADKTKGASDPLPMFRLIIFDRSTHYILWTLTESIDGEYMQKSHDHNFDHALSSLVQDFQNLTSRSAATNP